MRPPLRSLVLALAIAAFGAAADLQAQAAPETGRAFLRLCNKGTATVSLVLGIQDFDPMVYSLEVVGWFPLKPGACETVYEHTRSAFFPELLYLGFARFGANGHFTPARVTTVPDLGTWLYRSSYATMRYPATGPILAAAAKQLCVHEEVTRYTLDSKSDVDCSGFAPEGDPGTFQPLVAQLLLHPEGRQCFRVTTMNPMRCRGGDYYLDVAARPGDPELRVTRGIAPAGATAEEQPRASNGFDSALAGALRDLLRDAERRGREDNAATAAENARRDSAAADYRRRDSLTWVGTWGSSHASVGAFEPSWVGKKMVLRGTVSEVIEKTEGHTWIYFHFKESPDQALVGCSPEPNLLRELFGEDLNTLVGKTVEMAGIVEKYCSPKGSIRIVDRNQIRIVGAR